MANTRSGGKRPEPPAPKAKATIKKTEKKASTDAPAQKEKATPASKKLAVGDLVPDVELENDEGVKVKLHDLVKEKGAVFFMYPKANTPGCTKQACGFNDNLPKIHGKGYEVFGLSADKPKSQANWRTKYSLGYNLLCDPEFTLIKAFGAGKPGGGIIRSHVIVAKGGKIEVIANQVSPGESVSQATEFVESR